MLVGTVLMSVLAAAGFLAAPGALALFRRDDAEVIAIGALALRAQCVVLPLFGVSTVTNMLLQVTGQSGQATFLSLCRQGIFFVPFILLLPQLIGLLGVQLAQPAARPVYLRGDASVFAFIPAAAEAVGTGGTCCGGKIRIWKSRGDSPRLVLSYCFSFRDSFAKRILTVSIFEIYRLAYKNVPATNPRAMPTMVPYGSVSASSATSIAAKKAMLASAITNMAHILLEKTFRSILL